MSFWSDLFAAIFGRRRPASRPSPPAPPPAAPPPRPVPPPPVAQTPPPPAASPPPPAPAPAPAPPPPSQAAQTLTLDQLHQSDTTRLNGEQIDAMASTLGVEAAAVRAVIRLETAADGGFESGRPRILFEPTVFSRLTSGRFDSSHPALSQGTLNRTDLGRTQAERWAKLAEAFALDQSAALAATSWGLFQTAGYHFVACGFPSVQAFVLDISQSESRQLAAFEKFLRSQQLIDELQRRDWEGFARVYDGPDNVMRYAGLLQQSYEALRPARSSDGYLESLRRSDETRLGMAHFEEAARILGCDVAAIRAVIQVETGGEKPFDDTTGRPTILYEPHVFSKLTQRRFDGSHPVISYAEWRTRPYPKSQAERWSQLAQAYALDADAAIGATSWGAFQILGMNYRYCGHASAKAFISDYSQSEVRQLAAFLSFVKEKGIADELQRLDWEGFARIYNGPGQVDKYGRWLREAYEELKAFG